MVWIGHLISLLDRALNADIGKDSKTPVFVQPPPQPSPSPSRVFPTWAGGGSRAERDGRGRTQHTWQEFLRPRIPGIFALLILLAVVGAIALFLERALLAIPFGIIGLALIASSLIAQRSLHDHVARVATALETGGVPAGREAVSHIVGRETRTLDEAGVARAAIESLAENFSDGVVAPVFWLAVGGLPGAALYKAINTADSMIGHQTPRYDKFGWASARLDDLANLPASRLSGLLIVAAAAVTPGASAAQAWRTLRRDASSHNSPNAGYPEAALAGALGLKLAGPRVYDGVMIDDVFMGDGRREMTAADIRAALTLYHRADAFLIALLAAAFALLIAIG